jgi:predicted RNA-binding protein Jag
MTGRKFEGKTPEEALKSASSELGLPLETLAFTLLSTGGGGFLGLGGRKAAVLIDVEASRARAEEFRKSDWSVKAEQLEADFRRDGLAGTVGLDLSSDQTPASAQTWKEEPSQGTPRSHGGEKSSEQLRADAPRGRFEDDFASAPPSAEASETVFPTPPAGRDPAETLSAAGEWPPPFDGLDGLPLPPTRPGPGETVTENPDDPLSLQAVEELSTIVGLMGFSVRVVAKRLGERLTLELVGPESPLLIGPYGQTLDALEHVLVKILLRDASPNGELDPDRTPLASSRSTLPRIVVDAKNYRARRHYDTLVKLRKLIIKAVEGRRATTIGQLTPSDRRLVRSVASAVPGLEVQELAPLNDFNYLNNMLIVPRAGGGRKSGGDRFQEGRGQDPAPIPKGSGG